MTRYIFGLLMISSFIMQAPPKGQPDIRSIMAREALRDKLEKKAMAKGGQAGAEIIRRIEASRAESMISARDYLRKMQGICDGKKIDKVQGSLSKSVREAMEDPTRIIALATLLDGKPIQKKKTLDELAKLI